MPDYIYLIEEPYLVNAVGMKKIGKTKQKDMGRVKRGYEIGSRIIRFMQCIDCDNMETNILLEFNAEFTLVKGKEYFVGDEDKMIKIITSMVENEKKFSDNNYYETLGFKTIFDNYSKNREEEIFKYFSLYICVLICRIFPEYENDIVFRGSKKYVKIDFDNCVLSYINPEFGRHFGSKMDNIEKADIILQIPITQNEADILKNISDFCNSKILDVINLKKTNELLSDTNKLTRILELFSV